MNKKRKGFILKKKNDFSITVFKAQLYASIDAN